MIRTFYVRKAGSVVNIIDGGRPFIIMNTEKSVNIGVSGRPFHCPEISVNDLIGAIIPFGADKDKNFVKNIESATSIKEVYDICESWVNV